MGRGPTQQYHQQMHEDYVEGTLTCLKRETIVNRASPEFPLVLNIEPTSLCNLRCVWCPRERADKGPGSMRFESFARLIDEAAEHPQLVMLNFHKDGEPFLHPRFLDMVDYSRAKNVARTLHVNTNGMCLTDAVIERLLDSGLDDVTVSLDAARPETFARFKGVDALDRVERSVRRLLERREQRGLDRPFVRAKIMECDQIAPAEVEEFRARWTGVADMAQVTGIHDWGGGVEGLRVTDERSARRYPCIIMWYALVVNWNGQTTFCSVDWNTEILLGDAFAEGLASIWRGQKARDARRAELEGRHGCFAVCRDCVVWVSGGDVSDWLAGQTAFYREEAL